MKLQIKMPDDKVAGVHADFVSAWHTPDTFVLDFASAIQPPRVEDGESEPVLDALVVARVKIPPGQVFEIMKALEQQLSAWENETGRVRQPPIE